MIDGRERLLRPLSQEVQKPKNKSQEVQIVSLREQQLRQIKARIPDNYHPDLDDKNYRMAEIKEDEYHKVGEGAQGMVIAAKCQINGQFERVVLKRYNINVFDFHQNQNGIYTYTSLLREFQNLQYLIHVNIARMKDCFWSLDHQGQLSHVWIVTERMDFNLSHFFRMQAKHDHTSQPVLRDHRRVGAMLVQILRALDYLHQRGIMHRDVKPENIGCNKNFHIKLLDFGVSRTTNNSGDYTILVSTPVYAPLEVQLQVQYDYGVDIWATGLVALDFLNNKLYTIDPHSKNKQVKLDVIKKRILDVLGVPNGKYKEFFKEKLDNEKCRPSTLDFELNKAFRKLGAEFATLTNNNLKNLLTSMLCINPRRPLASELLNHPYLKKMNEEMKKKYDPISADDHQDKNERDRIVLMTMLESFSRQV